MLLHPCRVVESTERQLVQCVVAWVRALALCSPVVTTRSFCMHQAHSHQRFRAPFFVHQSQLEIGNAVAFVIHVLIATTHMCRDCGIQRRRRLFTRIHQLQDGNTLTASQISELFNRQSSIECPARQTTHRHSSDKWFLATSSRETRRSTGTLWLFNFHLRVVGARDPCR